MAYGIDVEKLIEERQKLRKALSAMDDLLRSLDVEVSSLDSEQYGKITLAAAIKAVVAELKTNITKDVVLESLRRSYPQLQPNPQSVAAALVKFCQGDEPFLHIEKRGAGNQPTIYSTEKTWIFKLTNDQLKELFDPRRTHGSGGWQSLFKRIQKQTDRESGEVILTLKMLLDMRHYFFNYGVGGWQGALRRTFLPHLPGMFNKRQIAPQEEEGFLF